MKTFDSGAKSSEEAPRLDLIPLASLRRQADRMAMGAASHGARNYEKGARDPRFIQDRKNHLAWHVARYITGDMSDDHLGAILANAGMLARLEELAAPDDVPVTYDEKRATLRPCPCGREVNEPAYCARAGRCLGAAHRHAR